MIPKESKFPYRRRLNQERSGLNRYIDRWKDHPDSRIQRRVKLALAKLDKVEEAISMALELRRILSLDKKIVARRKLVLLLSEIIYSEKEAA